MIKLASLAAVLLVVGSGTMPTTTATAAATPACHGRPATIVGARGVTIKGTNGPDVVVTHGAAHASTYGGDDLVCVTGGGTPTIDTGSGNDVVDASAASATVSLGFGTDTFQGGPHRDVVLDGPGPDLVVTGSGDDLVTAGETGAGPADHDRVFTGPGDDYVNLETTAYGSTSVNGGPGYDHLDLPSRPDGEAVPWVIDNRQGQVTAGEDTAVAMHGFEEFTAHNVTMSSVQFIGSVAAEWLDLTGATLTSDEPIRASLAGGDDGVQVTGAHRYDVDGGPGRNGITIADPTADPVSLDLASGVASLGVIRDFRDLFLATHGPISVEGSEADNHIDIFGVCVTIDGRAGDDFLRAQSYPGSGCASGATIHGGPGDDDMLGGTGDDTLIGDADQDRANGDYGTDTCDAEVRVNCESQ